MFLLLLVIGLVGLAAMALPAFGHSHGALSGHGAHGVGHAAHGGLSHGTGQVAHGSGAHASGSATAALNGPNARGALAQLLPADVARREGFHLLPSPRAIFSVLSLYGAFGNACVHAFHLPFAIAAIAAAVPALLVERLLVRPLWNLVFRLEAPQCSPLEQLVFSEAQAVTAFRNGRGMISALRDGRRVQLVASLRQDQQALPVRVGERLLIEDVDAANERVTVSLNRD